MSHLIIIPARLNSTRLPRKLLLAETGRPLIAHSVERIASGRKQTDVLVATDSEEIKAAAVDFARVEMTGEHPNGTSRAAEVVAKLSPPDLAADIICIVQADEPEISNSLIESVIALLANNPELECATAANVRLYDDNQNHVKCWIDPTTGLAVNFTRRLPALNGAFPCCGQHIGIYAYRYASLLRYAAAGLCERETPEGLEQLRAIALNMKFGVVNTNYQPRPIDTREDYDAFVQRQKGGG